MSNQTTRRCHWVPQVYLRAFAADASRSRVWRLGKDEGDPELKRIDKVAVRFHLYVPRDSNGHRDDAFEKRLAYLEQWFGSPYWKALQSDMIDLGSDTLRKMVSLLVATMFLRNPKHLQEVHAMHSKFVELYSGPAGVPSAVQISGRWYELDVTKWPAYRDASEDDIKRMWLSEIGSATVYAEMFMKMRWSIVFSDEPVFVTSDNPVTFLHPSLLFKGINNPDTLIVFPISPTRMLMMDHKHSEPANQYYPLKGSAADYNQLIWRGSLEHMFAHRHPDLVCAEIVEEAEQQGYESADDRC